VKTWEGEKMGLTPPVQKATWDNPVGKSKPANGFGGTNWSKKRKPGKKLSSDGKGGKKGRGDTLLRDLGWPTFLERNQPPERTRRNKNAITATRGGKRKRGTVEKIQAWPTAR